MRNQTKGVSDLTMPHTYMYVHSCMLPLGLSFTLPAPPFKKTPHTFDNPSGFMKAFHVLSTSVCGDGTPIVVYGEDAK